MTEPIPGLSLSPLEILAVLGALAVVLARWLPYRRAFLLNGAATVAVAGVALAATGLRWQLYPVVAVTAIVLVVAVARRGRGRMRRRFAVPATAAALLVLAAVPVAAWALPVPVYPEPTGEYAVGTAVHQWTDATRPEPFTADPDDHRTVVVQLWYPAEVPPGAATAIAGRADLEESQAVTDASADLFGIPAFLLADAAAAPSHAVFDAPAAPGDFPVVVFSPGLNATRTANTVLAEEWASRGYAVATVDHPYDAAVAFIDGAPVYSRNTLTSDDEAEIAAINRANIATRSADLSFVLTQLKTIGHVDTARAAVAGHSRGAVAALAALAADTRFDAAVHIDGGLEPTLPPGPFSQPALSITSPISAADNPDYIPNLEAALALGPADTYRLELPEAGHFSFTDAALFFPPVPSAVGTIGRTEGLERTSDATALFLDSVLRDRPADLPAELKAYGDLALYG
ncbi:alpha/beta hydrolase family protein [Glycomyces sp. NPDC048151]|uniref:alpha/beta hydrolase family protein n=1 Tax=Glycomyces sp. NPDC048151 TaxID=3364002 RepID=UPI00371886F9